MIKKIPPLFLFLFLIYIPSIYSIQTTYSGSIEETFDNDSRITFNDGMLRANGKLTPKPNILPVINNVISCWRFDQDTGNTILDSTPNNFHGTSQNMETADKITGVFGNALHFDGDNEGVTIPHNDMFNISQFTYEFWVKTHEQSLFVSEAILHLPLDDNAASTVVTDRLIAHNGAASANTASLHISGKINGAFNFNGNVQIEVDNDKCFDDLSNTFSYSFWINAQEIDNESRQNILSKKGTGASIEIKLGKDDAQNNGKNFLYIELFDNDSNPFYMHPKYQIPTNNWSHETIVLNGRGVSSLNVYIDGVKASPVIDSRLTFYADYTSGSLSAEYSSGTEACTYTTTRNSSRPASYCDNDGIIKFTYSNTPRFTGGYYDHLGFHKLFGLLYESETTNKALQSSNFSAITWAKANITVIDNDSTSPDSTQTADKCVAEADNGTIKQSYSLGTGKKLCFSIFIRGSANNTGSTYITVDGVNWTEVALSATEWRRFQCFMTGTNPEFGVRLEKANDTVYLWGAQLEENKLFATSYVPTTNASVYRYCEYLKYPCAGNRNPSEETIYFEIVPEYSVSGSNQLVSAHGLLANDNDSRIVFFGSPNGRHVSFSPNSTDSPSCYAQTYTQEIQMWQPYSVTAVCQNNNPYAELYVNKNLCGTEGTDNFTDPTFGNDFYIGHITNANNAFFGIIRRVVIFNKRLTQQEINRLNDYGVESFIGYDDTTELGSLANTNVIRIGENYVGTMDDIRIYDYALNSLEQEYLYSLKNGLSATMPIAHYKLNDDNDGTIVADSVFDNPGSIIASPPVSTSTMQTPGKINGAFSFNGNVCIEGDNDNYLDDLSNTFSYSFWINAQEIDNESRQNILSKKGTGASIEIKLGKDDAQNNGKNFLYIELFDNDSNPFYMHPKYQIPANNWSHVTIVLNGRGVLSLNVYIDGVKASPVIDSRLTFYADYTSGSLSAEYFSGIGTCSYTTTRNSSRPASYCDNDGIIKFTYSNTPRFTGGYYDHLGFHKLYGLLYESETTNKALYSSDFTATNWTKTNIAVTANDIVSPDNESTADKCVAEADNGTIKQLYSLGTVKKLCFSIFIRGSANNTGSTYITVDGVNWTEVTLSATEWRRFQCFMTGTNPEFGVRLEKANDTVYLWGAQLEENKLFATSYVPTTNASVYRYCEYLKYPCAGNRNSSEETIYFEIVPEYSVIGSNQLVSAHGLLANDNDSRIVLFGSQNGRHVSFSPNSTDSASCYAQTYSQEIQMWQPYSVTAVCQHNNPYAELYVNKILCGTEVTDNFTDPTFGNDFYIGHITNANNAFFGIIRRVVIFNKRLTQQEINRLNDYGVESFIGYDDTTELGSLANTNTIRIGENYVGKLDDIRIYDYALNDAIVGKLYNDGVGTELETVDEFCIISKYVNSDNGSYRFYVNSYPQQIFAELKTVNGKIVTNSSKGLELNKWNHVAVTLNNNSLSIYINGELDSTKEIIGNNVTNSTTPIKFGHSGNNDYWDGCLDEVIFRNEAISADQIRSYAHNYYYISTVKGKLIYPGNNIRKEDIANYESITINAGNITQSQRAYVWFGKDNDSMVNVNGENENEMNGFALSSGANNVSLNALNFGGEDFFYKIVMKTDSVYSTAPAQIDSITLSFTEKDTDLDGLSDLVEKNVHHTNPNSSDTDGDGIDDKTELETPYYNPFIANTITNYADTTSIMDSNDDKPDRKVLIKSCVRIDKKNILIRGISTNERPIIINVGNKDFVNTATEFSYMVDESDCNIVNKVLYITISNKDSGTPFSFPLQVPINDTGDFKIISPLNGATISIKGRQ